MHQNATIPTPQPTTVYKYTLAKYPSMWLKKTQYTAHPTRLPRQASQAKFRQSKFSYLFARWHCCCNVLTTEHTLGVS